MARLDAHSFDDPAWGIVDRGAGELARGEFAVAVASFTSAIEAFTHDSPTAAVVETFICRGVARARGGDDEAAIIDFSEAIRLDPERWLAYYNRGYAQELLTRFPLAEDDYSRAIDLHESAAGCYVRRGVCRKKFGDVIGARSDFAIARRLIRERKSS